ncbi:hypothetical protein QAD02_006475 [Eretmocerus hayati]|uniref:Uncharacterized protein n=1 Tax=Eretmocerus hayati TaxID=131215 RepID=A0ACC2N1F7_9HYME|nr:hypothetical protein QAD02_006475 [Eretmocerus hayati]
MYVEEAVAQQIVDQIGFGKFNLRAILVGALCSLDTAFSMISLGFVISVAACDFQMNTIEKGRLNAAPMLGMVIGSTMWGYVADLKGRKPALLASVALQVLSDFSAAVIPSYTVFVTLKVFSGIGFAGQLSAVYPFVGEFQPTKCRHQVLSCMELFWSFGIIGVSLLAWLIIPMKIEIHALGVVIGSWNVFVMLSTLPGVFAFLWLLTMPDTPKYLAESGKREEMLRVLSRMYVENTGNTAQQFREQLAFSPSLSISQLVSKSEVSTGVPTDGNNLAKSDQSKLGELLNNSGKQMKALLTRPHNKRIAATSIIIFCMSSTYYSLMTWFPELFQRFAAFEQAFPNESANICGVSNKLTNQSSNFQSMPDPYGCDTELATSVYVDNVVLGASCIPFAIIVPLTVHYVGYRFYLLLTASVSCAVTFGFFFVVNSTQNLILSCIFEAFTSLCTTIVFCILVDLFPTTLR